MNKALRQEFADSPPRAIVLDDNTRARIQMASRLKREGFQVVEVSNVDAFEQEWHPGEFDAIIADWDLSAKVHGDHVLERVRQRDWEVPFVLISGKLAEDHDRADVLARLLENGRARFVTRGQDAFEKAAQSAIELLERRDPMLLRLILKFRQGALQNQSVPTTNGQKPVREFLETLVSIPQSSQHFTNPLANDFVDWLEDRRK